MTRPIVEPIHKPDHIFVYWKREKFIVACIVVFGLGFNGASVVGPIFQGRLIDSLIGGDSFSQLGLVALTYILIIAGIQVMRYFKRFYIRRFANKTSAVMRFMIYNNIMHKSFEELDKENTGDLMTKAMSDVDLCVEGMRKFTTELFDTGVLMASFFIAMLAYDVRITLLSCLFIPAAMVLAEKLKTIIFKYSIAYRKKSSKITQMTYTSVDNAMLYRANGLETQSTGMYREQLLDYQEKAIKANILENTMQPIYNVIAMAGVILVIYLGGQKTMDGGWTIGAFSAYMTMFAALAVKASKAAKLFNSVQKSQISWQRIKPYLSEYQVKETSAVIPVEPVGRQAVSSVTAEGQTSSGEPVEGRSGFVPPVSGEFAVGQGKAAQAALDAAQPAASATQAVPDAALIQQEHEVSPPTEQPPAQTHRDAAPRVSPPLPQPPTLVVDALTFSYPDSQVNIIEDVHFTARQGDMIGITGAVASGKSTLGLALLGLYPYIGSIRIDGRELSSYSEYERSRMIAYLGHRPQLLSDTIYNNITLGGGQDIGQVLRDVCFDQDLAAMPDGSDTLVGNSGIRLSGGQQSRIALARTLLEKKKIIILDDPFAAVDMKTEESIIRNLKDNYRGSLILIVSHRLAIFPTVTGIVFLHADKSVEVGTHAELMRTSSQYEAIYNLQSTMGEDLDER